MSGNTRTATAVTSPITAWSFLTAGSTMRKRRTARTACGTCPSGNKGKEKMNEKQSEHWIYGGVRKGRTRAKVAVWIDEDGKELVYKPSGHPVIGGVYAMEIVRDGEKITRYGDGEYSHRSEDAELVARLEAEDRIARVQIEQAALARNDM